MLRPVVLLFAAFSLAGAAVATDRSEPQARACLRTMQSCMHVDDRSQSAWELAPEGRSSTPIAWEQRDETIDQDATVLVAAGDLEPSPLDELVTPPGTLDEREQVPTYDELEERFQIGMEAVVLFTQWSDDANLRALDALVTQYRVEKPRTKSGLWKLEMVYNRFQTVISEVHPTDVSYIRSLGKVIEHWSSLDPKSPTPHIVMAQLLRNHAYAALRGGDWEVGLKRLADARLYLQRWKDVASADPHWYELTIETLDEAAPIKDIVDLVDEASRREPSYYSAYFAAARAIATRSERPAAHLEALARLAYDRTWQSEASAVYARIYWVVLSELVDPQGVTDLAIDWERMSTGIADVVAQYPDQWNVQNFAVLMCASHQQDTTRRLLAGMKGRPLLKAWGQVEYFNYCKTWAEEALPASPRDPDTRKTSAN